MFEVWRLSRPRLVRWARLAAAAMCLVLAGVSALAPRSAGKPAQATVAVLVATRPLPAGHVLVAADLRVAHWPVALHPPATASGLAAVLGRHTAGALTTDEPVTATRLLGGGVAAGLAPGLRAVPLTVAAAAAGLVRAGDRVDVLTAPADGTDVSGSRTTGIASQGGTVVASGVRVLAVVPGADGAPATVVVAGDAQVAVRAAAVGAGSAVGASAPVTLVVLPP